MSTTEKITINISAVDLGKIDLMVEEGFYTNRTDFIRTGIKQMLLQHESDTEQAVLRIRANIGKEASRISRVFAIGTIALSGTKLERVLAENKRMKIAVIGSLKFEDDITPELVDQAIESIWIKGVFKAPSAVKKVLAGRIS